MADPNRRGIDGLTSAELSASRRGFWDDAWTELLARRIPGGTKVLVDVGCGLAPAAHALLPLFPATAYVGVDADEERLRDAARLLGAAPYADRVELRAGRAERLPCRDAEADAVLTTMTLQHVLDPATALREVARVLAPGGALVAVEPDNTSNLFSFDGVLEDVDLAFRALFAEQRRTRRPADVAIGPAVARLVEEAGLSVTEFFPYALGRARKTTAADFFARLQHTVSVVAGTLPGDSRAPESCRAAIAAAEARIGASAVGYGCQLVPVFVCVAKKT